VLAAFESDPAFTAQAVSLPSESDMAREIGQDVDPDAIFQARKILRHKVGKALALAATAWVALNVSQPLALFLAVLIICARSGGTEYMAGGEYMDNQKPEDEKKRKTSM
jgi:hypothetical protein